MVASTKSSPTDRTRCDLCCPMPRCSWRATSCWGWTIWRYSTRSTRASGSRGTGRLGDEVVAELWELDDGLRFLELSMRVEVNNDPSRAKRQLEDAVRDRGLDIDANKQTKTSTVLERLVGVAARRR